MSLFYGNGIQRNVPQVIPGIRPHDAKAEQITTLLSLHVDAEDLFRGRVSNQKKKVNGIIGTVTDATCLNISRGDLVFKARKDTLDGAPLDKNPFSSFNGLVDFGPDLLKYHQHYACMGTASDTYELGLRSGAPSEISVNFSGIDFFVNTCGRTLRTKEWVTWVPDTKEFDSVPSDHTNGSAYKRSRVMDAKVRARIVPLEDAIVHIAQKNQKNAELQKLCESFASSNTDETKKEIIQHILSEEITMHDMKIGFNCTDVANGGTGQLCLKV